MGVSLIYMPSQYIVKYMGANPINWLQAHKDKAKRGGLGDKCGVTPSPAVFEFLNLLHERKGLFNQKDYKEYCWAAWGRDGWIENLSSEIRGGLGVRLYRNFYPSMIDSLHVWALLAETQLFDVCFLDSTADAVAKTDLTLVKGSTEYRIALFAGSKRSVNDRLYKLKNRNTESEVLCIDVVLPMERKQSYGKKRWYEIGDFENFIQQAGLKFSPLDTPPQQV